MSANQKIKSALESLLFVWGDPLEAKVCAELFNLSVPETVDCFRELMGEYEERESGLRIREMDQRFQLCTNPENDDYIQRLCTPIKEKRLTQAALETMAIIAYRQPVTKGEIDSIRGVRSDRVLEGLIRRELVVECGRSTAIGRPILYGTTPGFLAQFGFESLEDLPQIEDIGTLVLSDSYEFSDELTAHQIRIPLEEENKEVAQ
ncbi:MAG: SMC-Scp complex subunit ScpB [Eubacteriales bacterium]|nr:SMC-Scp complex subunit ScpB [Eubacteriales bacterium]MDD4285462.1 SMC-Scp complex subunit ScpB [Eubacteriales bacterium]HPF18546.1 SMC-Scp complex subunit ScpB [Bacillota bacterium]